MALRLAVSDRSIPARSPVTTISSRFSVLADADVGAFADAPDVGAVSLPIVCAELWRADIIIKALHSSSEHEVLDFSPE